MIAADPLFGPIDIPDWLDRVLLTPEVQRLREVRLINTTTPHLAALSDTRRYTHTLGVLSLAQRVHPRLVEFSREERDALLIAAVLHDVGTPPFAHLFEYLLKALSGWTHEGMLKHIVNGDYSPQGKYAQLYFGNQLALTKVLETRPAETQLALDYVEGRGALGTLIAGKLDLDNVDNVYRMCSLLGFRPEIKDALSLTDALGVSDQMIGIPSYALESVRIWRKWRRKAYEVLAFDESSLQGQAMLTDAFSTAVQRGFLGEENWSMTDEELLVFLYKKGREYPELGSLIRRFTIGDFYHTIFIGWYSESKSPDDDLRLPNRREELRSALEEAINIPCCPYIFYDNGTFEKELPLWVTTQAGVEAVTIGKTSRSTLAAVFTPRRSTTGPSHRDKVQAVLERFGLRSSHLQRIPTKQSVYDIPPQAELPF